MYVIGRRNDRGRLESHYTEENIEDVFKRH